MKLFVLLATLVTLASCETGNEDADILAAISGTGQISLEVEHSFDNGKSFVPRGTLNIHSLRSSSASLDSVAAVTDGMNRALENLCNVTLCFPHWSRSSMTEFGHIIIQPSEKYLGCYKTKIP